jgi:hypothetical protein
MCVELWRGTIEGVHFQVERELDRHWFRVADAVEARSAFHAVAHSALAKGTYRARPTDSPNDVPELFSVPSWGQPIRFQRR